MKKAPNYTFKAQCLTLDEEYHIIDKLSSLHHLAFQLANEDITYTDWYNDSFRIYCEDYLSKFDSNVITECEKILHADLQRKTRLRKKIQTMFDICSVVIFVTLTFSDIALERSTPEYRRDLVSGWFKACCPEDIYIPYIANIDFGKENGREHYHGLIGCRVPKSQLEFWQCTYGSIKLETVRISVADKYRLSSYVSKMTNHAIKETTKRSHLIYSRITKKTKNNC